MSRRYVQSLLCLISLLVLGAAPSDAIDLDAETYTLPNGMTVILHEDHTLPQVTINTWFGVGSKDEAPGRSGFAHLFEHLMFMGTARVPGNRFDVLMEEGGGSNNASTSTDRTNFFSWGPSELLPTLLWLDADRLEALGENMTQEKLDLQREVVLNERRQNLENTPYGIASEIIPQALYPDGHPYSHSVIGSHEDIEAATVDDVKAFFATHYVPANASIVVAGDFDPKQARELIAQTFGSIAATDSPPHAVARPVTLDRELRRLAVDRVELARLTLVWHSPAIFRDGDAEMDLLADILADGPSSRLYKSLVSDRKLAQSISAYQFSKELGSEFRINITARPGNDLEEIKHRTIELIEEFKINGPSEKEVQRVIASHESAFLRHQENLAARANAMNRYRHYLGTANSFDADLGRYTSATRESLQIWANRVLGEGRLDLRILPRGAKVAAASLDQRPAPTPAGSFTPQLPECFELTNGIPVEVLQRPGSGLFSGVLLVDGGERAIPVGKAGLSSLTASMLSAGAAGRSATEFADAVSLLGADISASTDRNHFSVAVRGLRSHLSQTLKLFADAVLNADLEEDDFEREAALAINRVKARADDVSALAVTGARILTFGRDDPRGRPLGGFVSTLETLRREDVISARALLLSPARARFLFVGDFTPGQLKAELEQHFAAWNTKSQEIPPRRQAIDALQQPSLTVIDRPGAPQTMMILMRPVPPATLAEDARRTTLNILFGGAFTSRLNQNLREKHGYTYGAGSVFQDDGRQFLLLAYSAVQTAVTGPALLEFQKEFDRLAHGTVSEEERIKAVKTARQEMVDASETTGSLLASLQELAETERPIDHQRNFLAELDRIDLDSLNKLATSGIFAWDSLQIVLVGDATEILRQLKEAGMETPKTLSADSLI